MTSPLRCLWIGPSSGGLAWLRTRVAAFQLGDCSTHVIELASVDRVKLQKIVAAGLERIIVACPSRIDAPRELIELFRACCPEVPWAVASDTWWDGARRTGLRTPGYLTLPWYRWWDGWHAWLAGTEPALFEPSPPEHAVLPLGFKAVDIVQDPALGWVIGNCRQSLQAWSLVASACGHAVEFYTPDSCAARMTVQPAFHPEEISPQGAVPRPLWVLWDDSSSDTAGGSQAVESEMIEFFTALQRWAPQALAIAGLGLARIDSLDHLSRCHRQFEFFVKPSSGRALAQLLQLATHRRSTLRVESPSRVPTSQSSV